MKNEPIRELAKNELDLVAGGLNPQPLPPRDLYAARYNANFAYLRSFASF